MRDRSLFTEYADTPNSSIQGAGTCPALGRGTVKVLFVNDTGTRIPVTLQDAIHAPAMPYNLVSLGRLTTAALSYSGHGDDLKVLDCDRVIGIGHKTGGLYRMAIDAHS